MQISHVLSFSFSGSSRQSLSWSYPDQRRKLGYSYSGVKVFLVSLNLVLYISNMISLMALFLVLELAGPREA